MKLQLHIGDRVLKLKLPEPEALAVEVPGESCPHCAKPLVVAGAKKRIGGRDFYTAEAGCVACETFVGELRLYVSTLFGLEEDEAVMRLGVRIY